ncbi:Probable maleylacetoacetate isomerase 1 [Eumeta japonica]|uniref:Probable maleylacetoacetate isomerase 1 n=1 Tax=Eumeta variegata TaxID=151549 RepID=A0A4C1VSQ7_EUMVA|nr:Probable maleylacetoacetate isomerase 1 [Eumeta japonica]
MAILQYLEDTRPLPSLWPSDPLQRARVREICETVVSGIQPLQNVGLKKYFSSADQFQTFAQTIAQRGLQTLEELLKNSSGGKYCVGDQLTAADICFVPQIFNAAGRLEYALLDGCALYDITQSYSQAQALRPWAGPHRPDAASELSVTDVVTTSGADG